MSTHDYVIDDQTTPAFRSDLNNALAAIASNNSSTSEPPTTYAGMWWLDTTNNYLKIRDKNDANWIIVGEFDVANSRFELVSNSLTAASSAGIDVFNSSGTKIIDLLVASQATAEAGTNNTEIMTPLRVKQSIEENSVGYPQVITTLTSGSSYSIPAGAQALLIEASGGGGSGGSSQFSGNHTVNGNIGGDTTVTNATLGISITAKGGASGRGSTGGTASVLTGDSGGDILRASGAAGGAPGMNNFDISCSFGGNGNLVRKYLTGSNIGGQSLSYSIGAGGAGATAGSTTSAPGQSGFVKLTIW